MRGVLASRILGRRIAEPVGQRHQLLRRRIGQAEHDQIDLAHQVAAGIEVLAALGGDALDLDIARRHQALADAEPRRPRLRRR